jgi:uncharacterized membrane protein
MFNSTHWHLLLNHIPVLGVWFALAAMVVAFAFRNIVMMRSSWVLLVLCALMTIPVYLTGEPAEDMVEKLPGVSTQILDQHEDIGKPALIGVLILGALALGSLAISWRNEKWVRPAAIPLMVFTVLCGGLLGYTAYLGGQVRHSEIRSTTSSTVPPIDQHSDD